MRLIRLIAAVIMLAATAPHALAQADATPPAPSAPAAEVPAGEARIWVYRLGKEPGFALEPGIWLDDDRVAKMDSGSYFLLTAPAGVHVVRSNNEQSGVRMKFEGGKDYYVRVEIGTGTWKGSGRVSIVPAEQAVYSLEQLRPLGPKKFLDPRVSTPRPPSGS